jgi:hypothetical protein
MAEQALLAGDPAAFEQLVLQLMSAQNAARQSGEQLFTKLKVELRMYPYRLQWSHQVRLDRLSSWYMPQRNRMRSPCDCRTTIHRPLSPI